MKHPTYFSIRKFLRTAGFESKNEYLAKCKELGFPNNPDVMFYDRWEGWPKFLTRISQRIINTYLTYSTIKTQIKKLQYETKSEYIADAEKFGFPLDPEGIYWREWEGWDIFLSTLRSERSRKASANERWINSWMTRSWTKHNG